MRRWDGRKIEVIGNAQGLIAILCDESQAIDLAAHYPYPDTFSQEIGEAVERAYPSPYGACACGAQMDAHGCPYGH